jgi:hypothetical protein
VGTRGTSRANPIGHGTNFTARYHSQLSAQARTSRGYCVLKVLTPRRSIITAMLKTKTSSQRDLTTGQDRAWASPVWLGLGQW